MLVVYLLHEQFGGLSCTQVKRCRFLTDSRDVKRLVLHSYCIQVESNYGLLLEQSMLHLQSKPLCCNEFKVLQNGHMADQD